MSAKLITEIWLIKITFDSHLCDMLDVDLSIAIVFQRTIFVLLGFKAPLWVIYPSWFRWTHLELTIQDCRFEGKCVQT